MYVCVGFWGENFLYMGRRIRVQGRQLLWLFYFILFVCQKFELASSALLGDSGLQPGALSMVDL